MRFKRPVGHSPLTPGQFRLTRPLLANAPIRLWRSVSSMESETKYGRNGKRGGRAYRSRLEPFVDFIRAQRQQRRTWQEIADQLRTEKGCAITYQGLHQFYRRYVKRQARPHWEDGLVVAHPTRPDVPGNTPGAGRQAVIAAVPTSRPFRRPNPDGMNLNDPTAL